MEIYIKELPMYSKNIHNIITTILVAVAVTSSIFADGSIMVYNNSLYSLNFVVTTQSDAQKAADPNSYSYVQAAIAPTPMNPDGTVAMHAVDANYVAGSNVPLGTISNVLFTDNAIDFDVQVLDASGKIVSQINLGKSLGAVVNTDPARFVYVYSNVTPDTGVSVPNSGGEVVFWDVTHPTNSPSVQTFSGVAAA